MIVISWLIDGIIMQLRLEYNNLLSRQTTISCNINSDIISVTCVHACVHAPFECNYARKSVIGTLTKNERIPEIETDAFLSRENQQVAGEKNCQWEEREEESEKQKVVTRRIIN